MHVALPATHASLLRRSRRVRNKIQTRHGFKLRLLVKQVFLGSTGGWVCGMLRGKIFRDCVPEAGQWIQDVQHRFKIKPQSDNSGFAFCRRHG